MLLATARESGFEVSRRQLARWHRAGLLPKPEQEGLGRGKGTQSVYPEGTAKQLLALCELIKKERRFDYLAWQLWWAGFDVDIANVNEFIDEQWKYWDTTTSDLVDRKSGNLKSTILDALKNSGESRLKSKPLRQARRRVGTVFFREFATTLIQLVVGRSAMHGAASDILQKGLDMVQSGYEKKPPLWLPFGIATDQLAEFSTFMKHDFAKMRLVDLTDEELLLGRDKVVQIFHYFSLIRRRIDSTKIRMGLSILEPLSHKPAFQVALLRFYIAARDSTFAAQVAEFEEVMKKWTTSGVS